MKAPQTPTIDDENTERLRARFVECIRELQSLPFAKATIVPGVELVNATPKIIAHNLGRVPVFVSTSTPRGATSAGRIDDITRDQQIDRTQFVVLLATGYGATITVEMMVL